VQAGYQVVVSLPFFGLLAALQTRGWRFPAIGVGLIATAYGIASVLHPHELGSMGVAGCQRSRNSPGLRGLRSRNSPPRRSRNSPWGARAWPTGCGPPTESGCCLPDEVRQELKWRGGVSRWLI